MNPEREILNFWYNRHGFLTQNNIKAGQNKELYMIAVKLESGKAVECIHIEAQISVSTSSGLLPERGSVENEVQRFVKKKFEDKPVMDVMQKLLKRYGLESYKRVFVHGAMPSSRKKSMLEGFKTHDTEVLDFSVVLSDAVKALDGQAYQNHTVRTLQLMKFLLISEPQRVSELITAQLHSQARERFLKLFLSSEQNQRLLAKSSFEPVLEGVLKHSSLLRPDKLADVLSENLTTKSYNKLVKELYIRHPSPKRRKRKEKLLSSFLR